MFEDLVPSPTFSGQIRSDDAPNAIGFAPATTQLATPMTHGTPMADFIEEPQVLRDWDDTFVTRGLTELVITVGADNLRSFFFFHSPPHSGPISKMSGDSLWQKSLRVGITSPVQSWHDSS